MLEDKMCSPYDSKNFLPTALKNYEEDRGGGVLGISNHEKCPKLHALFKLKVISRHYGSLHGVKTFFDDLNLS